LASLEKADQSGTAVGSGANEKQFEVSLGVGKGDECGVGMDEVAATAVLAGEMLAEVVTLLGLVLHVDLVVLE
jgi:hypothetical protein